MEATITMKCICQREATKEASGLLMAAFQRLGIFPNVMVERNPPQPEQDLLFLATNLPYTDEAALAFYEQLGYKTVFRIPGMLAAEVISSLADRPAAMTEGEAKALAERIMVEAPWHKSVSVQPAHAVNDDFLEAEELFVCVLHLEQHQGEIYNAQEWGELIERLDYERRLNAYTELIEEPDARPFCRYVLDTPILPHDGTFSYFALDQHAARNYLLEASLPPWRSAVRAVAGVKRIYEVTGLRVPISQASFSMAPGDQALVVLPGEVKLLIRKK